MGCRQGKAASIISGKLPLPWRENTLNGRRGGASDRGKIVSVSRVVRAHCDYSRGTPVVRRRVTWSFGARISRGIAAVAAVVMSGSLLYVPVAVAEPLGALECAPSPQQFVTKGDGVLELDRDQEPESGGGMWAGRRQIGTGWTGNTRVGPAGWVYSFTPEGEVRRFRWLNGEWVNGGAYEVIGTGWNDWGSPAYRNRMTIDSLGDFYGLAEDGSLRMYRYDSTARTWADRVLLGPDLRRARFDLITASGPGVIYARETDGDLFRFQYDAVSRRLTASDRIGVGWQSATDITSPGGDLLYMSESSNGALRWYRYLGDEKWTPDSGHNVGGGITGDQQLEFQPDGCWLTPDGRPARPTVTPSPNAAASLLYTSAKRLHYSYVASDGRMANAQAADLSGNVPISFSVVPGFDGVTGIPGAGEYADGRVQLVGLGRNSEAKSSTQTSPTGAWTAPGSIGGFMTGPVALVRTGTGVVYGYGVDDKGCLWRAAQTAVNTELGPWRVVDCRDYAPVAPSIAAKAARWSVIVPTKSGEYFSFVQTAQLFYPPASLGGSGFSGSASTIVNGGGKFQVFARGADGQIYTQVETDDGGVFPGYPKTWTVVPGLTAAGAPSAVLSPAGTIEIVARGTDGYVYNTGERAAGTGTYRAWRDITGGAEKSLTDPAAVALPDQNLWVVGYGAEDGVPKLRKAAIPTVNRSEEIFPAFVDLPVVTTAR
ncbi:tachylectin-related carbohydrate-binding protein [Amycolatopsis japonica]|uniref:tachylectin-related carbohydrate-binding protein n=1 Tax=Amycolatopsis japonica TaxID=208439 RepID=UPI003672252A